MNRNRTNQTESLILNQEYIGDDHFSFDLQFYSAFRPLNENLPSDQSKDQALLTTLERGKIIPKCS